MPQPMTQLDHLIGKCMPWQMPAPELGYVGNRGAAAYVPATNLQKDSVNGSDQQR